MTTTQTPPVGYAASVAGAEHLATEIKRRWRAGEPPDAAAALADHPELLAFKSVVVALAYEEYCLREQRDGAPAVGPFCDRMPAYRASIRTVIEAHRLLGEHPEVLTPEPDWPEPGDRVDGLEVVAELGRGTFARAYLAFDPQTDRGCVLKLSPGRGGEGRALGPLQHPHITDVYWADRLAGMTAVCMPLLGVTTLDDVREAAFPGADAFPRTAAALLDAIRSIPTAAEAPAPVAAPGESYAAGAVAVGARIADALAYLHRQKREHGDLKPSNVVLAPGGHPYLIDFNLAGDAEGSEFGGTVPYMAPERLASLVGGTAAATDRAKADVYSFGVVLYELLTGRLPWAPNPRLGSVGAAAELLARRGAGLAWPEAACVPAPVAGVVAACLADAPDARPAAADVAAALSRWLSEERGEATQPAPKNRWRLRLGWAVASAAAVLVSLAATPWPTNRAPAEPAGAAEATVLPPPAEANDPFTQGLALLHEGKAPDALKFFHIAEREQRHERARDYRVYCHIRAAFHPDTSLERRQAHLNAAIDLGKEVRKNGADSAVMNNNVGYAYIQTKQYAEALDSLNLAVAQSPLPAARYNRAFAHFNLALEDANKRLDSNPQMPDRTAAEDILSLLQSPPESAEFYRCAALVLALSVHLDPRLGERAIDCMRLSVQLGNKPLSLVNDHILKSKLRGQPGFAEVGRMPRSAGPPRAVEFRLVEPVQP
jgi:tetratricopeptide (TPR) repeat protein